MSYLGDTKLQTAQPVPLAMSVDLAHQLPHNEKASLHDRFYHQCEQRQGQGNCRGCKHRAHARKGASFKRALAFSGSLLALAFFVFVAMDDNLEFDLGPILGCMGPRSAPSNLGKRQSTGSDSGTSGNGQSVFVKNKFYLIVALVGLAVVLLLGICLSAWCCKESFENPLCCPCYLCACCGGLACLECIACGLCAEAVETVA